MNGPEHYREAERLIKDGQVLDGEGADMTAVFTLAQVHATLALAAATATSVVLQLPISSDISKPWAKAIGLAEHEGGEA